MPFIQPTKPWLWNELPDTNADANTNTKYEYVNWSSELKMGYVAWFGEGIFFIDEHGTIFKTWGVGSIKSNTIVRVGYDLAKNIFAYVNVVLSPDADTDAEEEASKLFFPYVHNMSLINQYRDVSSTQYNDLAIRNHTHNTKY